MKFPDRKLWNAPVVVCDKSLWNKTLATWHWHQAEKWFCVLKEGSAHTEKEVPLGDSTNDFSIRVHTTEWRSSWGRVGLEIRGSVEDKVNTEFKLWHFCAVLWVWRSGLWRAQNNYHPTWDGWISQFQIKTFLCVAAVYPTCNSDTNSSSDPHSCEAINPYSYLCSSCLLVVLRTGIGFQEGSPTPQSHWYGG